MSSPSSEPLPSSSSPAPSATSAAARRAGVPRPGVQWEYRTITLPRGTSRGQARALLTEQAEYGRWELARVRLYVGGRREVQLRRKMIRVERTA